MRPWRGSCRGASKRCRACSRQGCLAHAFTVHERGGRYEPAPGDASTLLFRLPASLGRSACVHHAQRCGHEARHGEAIVRRTGGHVMEAARGRRPRPWEQRGDAAPRGGGSLWAGCFFRLDDPSLPGARRGSACGSSGRLFGQRCCSPGDSRFVWRGSSFLRSCGDSGARRLARAHQRLG